MEAERNLRNTKNKDIKKRERKNWRKIQKKQTQ
jgi:hypothetical protein